MKIFCITRDEYNEIIKATKEIACFDNAVTDFETIRKECENMTCFVDPYEIYGIVYIQ